ncbi:hypothetical protein BAUCODRAFT_51210, partial [Baudoinia panamericana UAMH 10762]
LEAEYCPPLDPALLSAIVLDYDLEDSAALQTARRTLDELKESALVEEAAGFDPSGTGAQDVDHPNSKRAQSRSETNDSETAETDLSSLSNRLSTFELEDFATSSEGPVCSAEELEGLDEETKLRLLQDVFAGKVSTYSIAHTLRKCSGRWQAAMEELLNQVYFEEAEDSETGAKVPVKGIEAFFDEGASKHSHKAKSKSKRLKQLDTRRATSLPVSPSQSPVHTPNKWQTASDDVDFIASRTRISSTTVTSVYNEKGASVPQTISALLKLTMEESKHIVTDDTAVAAHARDLGHTFPTIAPSFLAAIIRLTHPSTTAAFELAEALTKKPRSVEGGGIHIIPRYVAPSTSDDDSYQPAAQKTRKRDGIQWSDVDSPPAAAQAIAYASARSAAFSQASAAHRRAKSDRLMGGAAAYYGQLGREYGARTHAASEAAADALAAAQSSATQVDLHGIDVLNGVRIALEKADEWWQGLGESRTNGRLGATERSAGYHIVVGLGRHSEGGKGKLGPAVSKALRNEGWRIEPAGAVIVVKGK